MVANLFRLSLLFLLTSTSCVSRNSDNRSADMINTKAVFSDSEAEQLNSIVNQYITNQANIYIFHDVFFTDSVKNNIQANIVLLDPKLSHIDNENGFLSAEVIVLFLQKNEQQKWVINNKEVKSINRLYGNDF